MGSYLFILKNISWGNIWLCIIGSKYYHFSFMVSDPVVFAISSQLFWSGKPRCIFTCSLTCWSSFDLSPVEYQYKGHKKVTISWAGESFIWKSADYLQGIVTNYIFIRLKGGRKWVLYNSEGMIIAIWVNYRMLILCMH